MIKIHRSTLHKKFAVIQAFWQLASAAFISEQCIAVLLHKRRHAHMYTLRAPPSFLLVHGWMLDLDVGCWMKILVFNCMLLASWLANEADVMNACTHMHTHMRYGNFFLQEHKTSHNINAI